MSLNQIQSSKHKDHTKKNCPKKIAQKIEKNPPLPFKKKFSRKLFVEFLTFHNWNCLGGTKNYVYRRRLHISLIYRVKKWNIKCTPSPPTYQPRTASSSGPFKID